MAPYYGDEDFPTDPALAVVKLQTRMQSVDNHIKDIKISINNQGDKTDRQHKEFMAELKDRNDSIDKFKELMFERYHELNFKIGIITGIGVATSTVISIIVNFAKVFL